jgi:hypothetical protein
VGRFRYAPSRGHAVGPIGTVTTHRAAGKRRSVKLKPTVRTAARDVGYLCFAPRTRDLLELVTAAAHLALTARERALCVRAATAVDRLRARRAGGVQQFVGIVGEATGCRCPSVLGRVQPFYGRRRRTVLVSPRQHDDCCRGERRTAHAPDLAALIKRVSPLTTRCPPGNR